MDRKHLEVMIMLHIQELTSNLYTPGSSCECLDCGTQAIVTLFCKTLLAICYEDSCCLCVTLAGVLVCTVIPKV